MIQTGQGPPLLAAFGIRRVMLHEPVKQIERRCYE